MNETHESDAPPAPRPGRTVQVCPFAANENRRTARRLAESPRITVSAAVLGFSQLPAAAQADLITEARRRHAADRAESPDPTD